MKTLRPSTQYKKDLKRIRNNPQKAAALLEILYSSFGFRIHPMSDSDCGSGLIISRIADSWLRQGASLMGMDDSADFSLSHSHVLKMVHSPIAVRRNAVHFF